MATNTDKIKAIQKAVGTTADGLWGPATTKAVAAKLKCNASISSIQRTIGATADGIVGSRTLTLLTDVLNAKPTTASTSKHDVDVFLDPGHTADFAREHPSQFTNVDWSAGKYKEIAEALGFIKSTNDSLEHMLNVKIAEATKQALEAMGKTVVLYDDKNLSNSAEIHQVYTRSNALKPKAFVSIHNNAAGSSGWKALSCNARGPVALYYPGRTFGKELGTCIVNKLRALKGPDNRAEHINTSTVGVLSKADPSIPATLIEVGFYDNLENLYFMAKNLKAIGQAIADGIKVYIG